MNALNSGTGPEGFVKGGGTQTTGLTTGPAGDNPNESGTCIFDWELVNPG